MVQQKLVVRNPPNLVDSEHAPEEGYTMWGTLPLPRGTDPDTIGNNFAAQGFGAFQQYRRLAQTRRFDIYEWFVYNPGALGRQIDARRNEAYDTVFLSEAYRRPPQLGKKNARFRSSDPTATPGYPGPINSAGGMASLFDAMNSNLDYLGGARLVISGLANDDQNDVTETVFLTSNGVQNNNNVVLRSGDCCITRGKHVNTVNFGSFHIYWTVLRGRMDYQLTIHWHNGIPRSDVLVKSIKLVIKGTHEDVGNPELAWTPAIVSRSQPGTFNGAWNIWSEWSEPAMSVQFNPNGSFNTYILKPHAEGKYYPFPRMARRTWRLILSPQRPGGVFIKPQVYPGWGVCSWRDGGFLSDQGRVWPDTGAPGTDGMFAHIKDASGKWIAPDIVTSWTQTVDSELFQLINTDQTTNSGLTFDQVHLPGTGQRYGGPTGADDKYRQYGGIKPLGANERAGLVEHSILMMRHYARDWTGMYEPDGSVVDPIAHCNPPGSSRGDWTMNKTTGFSQSNGYYSQWNDAGFGWSSTANRRIRTLGSVGTLRDRVVAQWSMHGSGQSTRLQTYSSGDSVAFVNGQGWDNWDVQHRGIGWGHAGALYWLTGDEIARLYIIGEAEYANMTYWHGTGAANSGGDLTQPGIPSEVGRDYGWSMAAISRACMLEPINATDSDDTTNALSERGARWMTGPIRRFIVNTDMGRTPAGLAWHTGLFSKPMETPPFLNQYYVHQLFEMDYTTHGLQWIDDVAPPEFFKSTRNVGLTVDPKFLMREWLRGVDALWTVEAVTPTSMAVLNGGSGYTNGDTVYLCGDKDKWGIASPNPTVECKMTLNVAAGVVTSVTITIPGIWSNECFEGNDQWGFGAAPYAQATNITFTSRGVGYMKDNGKNTYKVEGGRPIGNRDSWKMRIRITDVDASGGILSAVVTKVGRYEEPPVNATLVWDGDPNNPPPPASGAVATLTMSASGVGLRVNPTWSAPSKSLYAGSVWKIAPIRTYPNGPTWASRTEWDGLSGRPPRDICLQPGMRDRGPGQNPSVGSSAQENNAPGHQAALAHALWCGSDLAAVAIAEYYGAADVNAVRNILKARGFGQLRTATNGSLIDFWWPIYSALGPGT